MDDIGADCFKTGMLGSVEVVEIVGETLALYKNTMRVIDPVMIAKGGHPLLQEKAISAVRSIMIPLSLIHI